MPSFPVRLHSFKVAWVVLLLIAGAVVPGALGQDPPAPQTPAPQPQTAAPQPQAQTPQAQMPAPQTPAAPGRLGMPEKPGLRARTRGRG